MAAWLRFAAGKHASICTSSSDSDESLRCMTCAASDRHLGSTLGVLGGELLPRVRLVLASHLSRLPGASLEVFSGVRGGVSCSLAVEVGTSPESSLISLAVFSSLTQLWASAGTPNWRYLVAAAPSSIGSSLARFNRVWACVASSFLSLGCLSGWQARLRFE